MAGSDASEGQAVWQPGGAEEDSRLREGNRHLHLAYDDEEEVYTRPCFPNSLRKPLQTMKIIDCKIQHHQTPKMDGR